MTSCSRGVCTPSPRFYYIRVHPKRQINNCTFPRPRKSAKIAVVIPTKIQYNKCVVGQLPGDGDFQPLERVADTKADIFVPGRSYYGRRAAKYIEYVALLLLVEVLKASGHLLKEKRL